MDISIMEKAWKEYTRWTAQKLPEDLMAELEEIRGSKNEIYDRFCKDIAFGTSGMREKMGVGSNRINSVTLRKASMGIGRYLREVHEHPNLAIAYDTRINSREYAEGVAEVFAKEGVEVFLFDEPTPVPVLSFAVREMSLACGIMITASHNPKEYNGYKVYDRFGNQLDEKNAAVAEAYIRKADPFADSSADDGARESAEVKPIPKEIKKKYLQALDDNTPFPKEREAAAESLRRLRVCYTSLNGSGRHYVLETLKRLGMKDENILEVESQKLPDGNFTTCTSPNPEYAQAFSEALKVCDAETDVDEKPHLILATDPDSDRLGVMCLNEEGAYVKLSGNQVGELLFDYICRCRFSEAGAADERKEQKSCVAFKSFVSSPLAEEIGRTYGVKVKNVFTGFKNIACEMEKIKRGREAGGNEEFLFGFEESLGYLCGDYTRDKDGVMAARLVCLAAAELLGEGRTLCSRLRELYEKYGYMTAMPFSVQYAGEKDRKRAERIIAELFAGKLKSEKITKEFCYREKEMYCADLAGGHRLIIRPSGTEPKLKIYIFARGGSTSEADKNAAQIKAWTEGFLREVNKI